MKEWYFTEQEYQAAQYALASKLLENARTTADCDNAAAIFTALKGYKDAASKIELCSKKAVLLEKKTRYDQALFLLRAGEHTVSNILNAKTIFQSLGDFADCAEKVKECNDLLNDQVLSKAERLIQTGTLYNLNAAITDLQKLNGYKSANALIAVAEKERLQIQQKEAADAAKRKKQIRYLSAGIGGLVLVALLIWAAQPGCMIHQYAAATCTAPQICTKCGAEQGKALGHDWQEATCQAPKTCKRCGKKEGEKTAHTWQLATCETPMTCTVCGATQGKKRGHNWVAETKTSPKMCKRCHKMEPMRTPENGKTIIDTEKDTPCRIQVDNTHNAKNCYVKLKDAYGKDVFSFFVQAHSSATAAVPEGDYYVYFAQGNDWYGKRYLFGEDTACSMDVTMNHLLVTWTDEGSTSTRLEYTLNVSYGHFNTRDIDISEF